MLKDLAGRCRSIVVKCFGLLCAISATASAQDSAQARYKTVAGGGVDDASLLNRFAGDAQLLRGVAELFLESESGLRSQLAGALSRNNGMEVSRTAHNLMGSVGNFGAERAMALAGELELMGRRNKLSGAGKVFESLVQTLDDLRSQLNGTMQARRVGQAGSTTGL